MRMGVLIEDPLSFIRPKVSVITVVYNGVKTIEAAIQSVLSQTYSDVEYIVIDGGSTDGTTDILSKYTNGITSWVSEPDNGIYDAMNKAIGRASGQWLYFLGADDRFFCPTVLESIFGDTNLSNKVQVLYGNVIFARSRKAYGGYFNNERIMRENICHQAIFYNVEVFKTHGLYNLRYNLLADWEFNMRWFPDQKVARDFLNYIICEYNEEGSSVKKDDVNFGRDYYLILYRHFPLANCIKFLIKRILESLSHKRNE